MGILQTLLNSIGLEKKQNEPGTEARILTNLVDQWAEKYGLTLPADINLYGSVYKADGWVYVCVRTIAESATDVIFNTYERRGKVIIKVEDPENPISTLLRSINPHTTENDFKEATMTALELQGNAYYFKAMDRLGIPRELYFMRPDWVKIIPDRITGIKGYLFDNGAQAPIAFEPQEILHFKYHDPQDYFYGASPLAAIRVQIEADLYSNAYSRNFYKNSARPDGILTSPGRIEDADYKRMQKRWDQAHKGVERSHRIAILEGGMDYKQVSMTARDSQFIEQNKLIREQILAVFRVPPALVGIFEYANYANSNMQERIFWTNVMSKKINRISDYINEFLIAPVWDNKFFIKADYSNVEALKENEDGLHARVREDFKAGLITRDEARGKIGDDPIDNAPIFFMPISALPGEPFTQEPQKALPLISQDRKKAHRKVMAQQLEKAREQSLRNTRAAWKRALKNLYATQKIRLGDEIRKRYTSDQYNHAAKEADWNYFDIEALWSEAGFDQEIIATSKSYLTNSMRAGFESAQRISGIELTFEMDKPWVKNIRDALLYKLKSNTDLLTISTLKDIIQVSFEDHRTIDEMIAQIEKTWDWWSGYRAERIARTEAANAYGTASHRYYQQAGLGYHRWLTMQDESVSEECQANEEQGIIPMDEPFQSGEMHEPNHPNCRCSEVPSSTPEGEDELNQETFEA